LSRSGRAEGDRQLGRQDSTGFGEGGRRQDNTAFRLHDEGALQRVEANGSPPLMAGFLGVQDPVPPQLRHDPHPNRKPALDGVLDRPGLENGSEEHLHRTASGIGRQGQWRRPGLPPEAGGGRKEEQ